MNIHICDNKTVLDLPKTSHGMHCQGKQYSGHHDVPNEPKLYAVCFVAAVVDATVVPAAVTKQTVGTD